MRVLLSIKPKYVDMIFSGRKKFEFRKSIFKNLEIDSVLVYSSHPVKMVVGEFQIKNILSDSPIKLWDQTEKFAGVERAFFDAYFSDRKLGFAIEIKEPVLYLDPLPIEYFNLSPPQSFAYLR